MDKPAWVEGCCNSLICFLKHSPPLFTIAIPSSLAFTLFLWFGFSPFLVSVSLLLFSTIFVKHFSHRKLVTEKEAVVEKLNQELLHEYEVESTEFPLDGESSDDSPRNEGLQHNWKMPFNNAISQSLHIFESEAEEEEEEEDDGDHLIEISLPPIESNSVDATQVSKPMLSPEFDIVGEKEGMMDVLEEMDEANEEDNLIEIDLAIGSIKHSNFDLDNY